MKYMEDNHFYDTKVTAISFLTREHLTKPETAFLSLPDTFKYVNGAWDSTTQVLIMDDIEPYIFYDSV
ncbi:hypothetical protein ACOY43_28050, partial [Klebsiella pneumoniae]|uniref:hypothetical protein n=1 Tax=Klebsiella pneumoniae TaxID=573 RepID=UPI003BCE8403